MKRSPRTGFTLIELIIVLAIGSLILVIVFLAVGGAQRSRRDSGRKDAVNRAIAERTTLLSDNGVTPAVYAIGVAIGCEANPPTAVITGCPDGVVSTTGTNFCGNEASPGSYPDTTKVGVDDFDSSICIRLESGALYVKNYI